MREFDIFKLNEIEPISTGTVHKRASSLNNEASCTRIVLFGVKSFLLGYDLIGLQQQTFSFQLLPTVIAFSFE